MVTEAQARLAIERRKQLKLVAEARGRGFTRIEAQRFLGGAAGVSALRAGTRAGFKPQVFGKISPDVEPITRILPKALTPAQLRTRILPKALTPAQLRTRGRQDPVARFIKQEIPLIAQDIFKTFVPDIRDRQTIQDFSERIQTKSDETIQKLENVKRDISELLDPSQRLIRESAERNINFIENQQLRLNTEVKTFNKQFTEKELSQKQFDNAQKKADSLAKKQSLINAKSERIDREIKAIQQQREFSDPTLFFTETIKGIATSPISLVQFGLGVITRPIKTTEETIKGIKELPARVSERPFTTLGLITGEIIGTSITLGFLRSLISTNALVRSPQGKSFIIEKPTRVTKTPFAKTFPLEIKFGIDDAQVKTFLKNSFANEGRNFEALSGIDKNFIVGQVKAKIRNNPELFIPVARKIALRRAKVKNLRQFLIDRLEGKFDQPIPFDKLRPKGKQPSLSETQQIALKRFGRNLESQRIEKAKILKKQIEKDPLGLLTEKQRLDFIKSLKRRIELNPELTLTKAQRTAIKNAKRMTELFEIKRAALKGLEPRKVTDLLTLRQKVFIRDQIDRALRFSPRRFLPKQRKVALNKLQAQQEKLAIERAKAKNFRDVRFSDLVSPEDIKKIRSNLEAKVKQDPNKFVRRTGGQSQQLIQKQKQLKSQEPVFRIIGENKLSDIQKAALNRLNNVQKTKSRVVFRTKKPEAKIIKGKKVIPKLDLRGIPRSVGGEGLTESQLARARGAGSFGSRGRFVIVEELSPQFLSAQRSQVNLAIKNVNDVRGRMFQSQDVIIKSQGLLTKQIQLLKQNKITLGLFSPEQTQINSQISGVRERIKELQKQKVLVNSQLQFFDQNVKQLQAQRIVERQRQPQRSKQLLEKQKTRIFLKFPKLKKKKKVIPLIKFKGKVTPFIKQKPSRENKFKKLGKPTTLPKAKRRLLKELDSTLRASGFLQDAKGNRIKPRSLPREFRFSKNKRTPKIIVERSKFRLDSSQEKSSIQRAKKLSKSNLKSTKLIKMKKKK